MAVVHGRVHTYLLLVIMFGAGRIAVGESVFYRSCGFLVLALFREGLGSLLGEGGFVEDFVGKTGIEFTTVVEDLNGAASVVLPGDLKRRPDAVFQLVVGIDGDVFVDLLSFFILGG